MEKPTEERRRKMQADRRSAPSPCLDWNCQKEMKAVLEEKQKEYQTTDGAEKEKAETYPYIVVQTEDVKKDVLFK